jgi:iron-sulfur cluster repair protein YtfE (RIC family)
MSIVKLTAEDIAEQQLITALRLWQNKEYVSAITLAGAAEEILGKRLRKLGKEPSFDNLRDAIVRIAKIHGDEDPKTEKLVAELLNITRNELKHYAGDEALEFDLREDSVELLERAITNYMLLTGIIHEEMIQFWSEIDNT